MTAKKSRELQNGKSARNQFVPNISKFYEIENLFNLTTESNQENDETQTRFEKKIIKLSQSNIIVLLSVLIFLLNIYYFLIINNKIF